MSNNAISPLGPPHPLGNSARHGDQPSVDPPVLLGQVEHEQRHHHVGMMRPESAPLECVGLVDRATIQRKVEFMLTIYLLNNILFIIDEPGA